MDTKVIDVWWNLFFLKMQTSSKYYNEFLVSTRRTEWKQRYTNVAKTPQHFYNDGSPLFFFVCLLC